MATEAIKSYTTKVPVNRTASDVQEMLGYSGATEVMIVYAGERRERRPVGVRFTLDTPHGRYPFELPINIDGVARALARQVGDGTITPPGGGITRAVLLSREHAERVAWRIAHGWLDYQLALVEAELTTFDQAMLPHLLVEKDRTLYDQFVERGLLELEAKSS